MKINILEKTKNSIKLEVEGEGHTFGHILQDALLKEKGTDWAGYDKPHPLFEKIIVFLRTTGEATPEKVLVRALGQIRADCKEFLEKFEAQPKKP